MSKQLHSTDKRTLSSDVKRFGNFLRNRSVYEKVGAGVLVAVTAAGVAHANTNAESISEHYTSIDTGLFDSTITSISIDGDATIREEAAVGNPNDGANDLYVTDPSETYTIPLAQGAEVKRNENGNWFGVSVLDIAAADKELAEKLGLKDKDGIVWINEQRASTQKTE